MERSLQRTIGPVAVVAISISAMLGSGIFVLPGLAATKTGASVWLAYVLAGLCVLPAALSKSELATAMPTSGGTYVYVDRTMGPLAGTAAGLGLWAALMLKSAFALIGFSAYLRVLADVPARPTALVVLVAIVALNVVGVSRVSKVQTIVVGTSLVALLGLGLGGLGLFERERMGPLLGGGVFGFAEAVGFVFVAFAGVTKIAAVAEEVRDPARNIPRGILASLLLVTLVYGTVTLVFVGVIPMAALKADLHPVFTLAVAEAGPIAGKMAAVLGVVTMSSMAVAGLLAASRFPFAMGRDRLLPEVLAGIHPRFRTPVAGILATGAAMGVVIAFLDVEGIAKIASAIMILLYLLENVAVIVLREARIQWYKPGYSAPLYPYTQVLGIVICLALLVMLGPMVPLSILSILVPGGLLYFVYGRHKTDRRGVFGMRGERKELVARPEPRPITGPTDFESATVIVPLLGDETSAESLVEVGAALAEGGRIEVLNITEVPEQLALDHSDEDPATRSLRRRLTAMATDKALDLVFADVRSHDSVRTVSDATAAFSCEWAVMQWQGRSLHGIGILSPLGWLGDHLPCHLAVFKDAGIRYTREILVHPEPGPNDALVAHSADTLAQIHGARLTFVGWVADGAPESELESRRQYLDALRPLCATPAEIRIVRGEARLEALVSVSAAYDLLVMGAPPEVSLLQRFRGTEGDRLTDRAACSVLRLKTSKHAPHRSVEKAPRRRSRGGLADFLPGLGAAARLGATRKDAVFAQVAERMAELVPSHAPAVILEGLLAREKTQSTSLGMGIAIPHATLEGLDRTHLAVVTLERPVDYGALDQQPVDLLFVTVGPPADRERHLVLLSSLARLIRAGALVTELRAARTSDDIVAAVTRAAEASSEEA